MDGSTGASHYPVIVLGGGTMGLAAAWDLGKRGIPALVLEQFGIVHDRGSHSGQTRVIRHAYAESPEYVPLVRRADDLFVALEAETGNHVLHRTGGLDLAGPGHDHARLARLSAEAWAVPFEWLDGAEVRHRYPAWTVPDDWEACFSPLSGFLHVDATLSSLAAAARQRGVEIRPHEAARSWHADGAGIRVETDDATYTADHLIVTAGAWAGQILAGCGLPLTVLRKVLWWFAVEDPAPFRAERFPVFISESDAGHVYGFPLDAETFGQGLKLAEHSGGELADPDTLDRNATDDEAALVAGFAATCLGGVTTRIERRAVCMYTMTPDQDFIIDRHPERSNVTFGAGFSGHGFKFATAVGELLVNLALDPAATPPPFLSLERFAVAAVEP
ncbi:MAG: N-methyl-L-tryptophan oxidase [Chloroflexota bacterium]|nr:N-methyl-L-tryptophan oxidase [Chloroflexota bacterium]